MSLDEDDEDDAPPARAIAALDLAELGVVLCFDELELVLLGFFAMLPEARAPQGYPFTYACV